MDEVHRASDGNVVERNFLTFDRKIPVTWALGVAAAFAAFLIAMYYQQDATSKKVGEVASDVKLIQGSMQLQGQKSLEDSFTLRDINRRLTVLEAREQQAKERR